MTATDRANFLINFCNGDRNRALVECFCMARAYINTKLDQSNEYWSEVAKRILGLI